MSPVLDQLTRALADRYRIERELGQGGMAKVYLSQRSASTRFCRRQT